MIETPLQLLNSIEAIHHLHFSHNILLILLTGSFKHHYFKNLVREEDWDAVHYIDFKHINREYDFGLNPPRNPYERFLELLSIFDTFRKRRRLERIAKSFGYTDNLILGNYLSVHKDYMRHFANTLEHGNLYLIDDGTDTIRINEERHQNNNYFDEENTKPKSWFKHFKTTIGNKYIYWNGKASPKVIFFTCYDIDVKPGDVLIKHEYDYLRYQSSISHPSDHVYFLGQCLIDDGYTTKERYLAHIKRVKDYFNTNNLVYIPHPRESVHYVDMLRHELSVQVNWLDVPIEYEITIRRNRPRYLCSFFSSALINCSLILNDSQMIKAFHIPPVDIMPLRVEEVQGYYNYFISNTDIEIISTPSDTV